LPHFLVSFLVFVNEIANFLLTTIFVYVNWNDTAGSQCVCLLSRTGDLSLLDTHAIVSCNNENFSDIDPQTTRLFDRAGPELRQELINSVRGPC